MTQVILLYQHGVGAEADNKMNPEYRPTEHFSWFEFGTIPIIQFILIHLDVLFQKSNNKIKIKGNNWIPALGQPEIVVRLNIRRGSIPSDLEKN